MRAQVSMEYMILMGFTLLLLGPLLILYSQHNVQIQESFTQAQATRTADSLIASAERVYYAGPPSKERILLTIPDHVRYFEITNSSVEFTLSSPPGNKINSYTQAPLIPATLNPARGRQYFDVQATSSGVVISES